MLLTSQHRFAVLPSRSSLYNLHFNRSSTLSLAIALRRHLPHHVHFPILKLKPLTPHRFSSFSDPFRVRVYESEGAVRKGAIDDFNFDSLLSFAELACLLSSAILSIGFAVNSVITGSKKELLAAIGNRAFYWGIWMLVCGVLIGAWLRRRQWRRICKERVKGGLEVNLLERIEKLEDDLRSSATVIRVLSRQLEKLGIRFRVTRKALKEPVTETAALAQKNSEATRALAVQSDILEKELGEIQKVLLAMQEQQQKQLDLILAIGKTGKLWEGRRETTEGHDTLEKSNSAGDEVKQIFTRSEA